MKERRIGIYRPDDNKRLVTLIVKLSNGTNIVNISDYIYTNTKTTFTGDVKPLNYIFNDFETSEAYTNRYECLGIVKSFSTKTSVTIMYDKEDGILFVLPDLTTTITMNGESLSVTGLQLGVYKKEDLKKTSNISRLPLSTGHGTNEISLPTDLSKLKIGVCGMVLPGVNSEDTSGIRIETGDNNGGTVADIRNTPTQFIWIEGLILVDPVMSFLYQRDIDRYTYLTRECSSTKVYIELSF